MQPDALPDGRAASPDLLLDYFSCSGRRASGHRVSGNIRRSLGSGGPGFERYLAAFLGRGVVALEPRRHLPRRRLVHSRSPHRHGRPDRPSADALASVVGRVWRCSESAQQRSLRPAYPRGKGKDQQGPSCWVHLEYAMAVRVEDAASNPTRLRTRESPSANNGKIRSFRPMTGSRRQCR